MDTPIANELQCWREKLVAHILEIQLGLVTFSPVERQLAQLPAALLLDRFVPGCDIAFDRDVVFEVLIDDAWRDLAHNLLEGDVGLQSWLEVLDNARFSDLEATQINHSKT